MKTTKTFAMTVAAGLFSGLTLSGNALALDNIIRPQLSPRSAAMGGVRIMTGLYEENFFANPARAAANPKFRLSFLDPTVEINSGAIKNVNKLSGSGDTLTKFTGTAGTNNHVRVQTAFPAVFFPTSPEWKLSIGFGVMSSTQVDLDLRKSYNLEPQVLVDAGPALTVAKKFLANDELAVGLTAHYMGRVSSSADFGLVDIIKGKSLKPENLLGAGSQLNFDLGSTYVLPWRPISEIELSTGLAINNLLGGKYSKLDVSDKFTGEAIKQPATLGLGVAARVQEWKWLTDSVLSLEFTDIGNNKGGSLFRLIHLGAETHWSVLIPRVGINQGYLCAGLGLDLRFVTLDLSTYGEEMSLNSGGLEDRRYAFRLAFQL